MIKYFVPDRARILFIGINPHNGSYARGVPFSNNKTFWYLLSDSGTIREKRGFLKDDRNLKEFYAKRFSKEYGLGLLNVVDRPTRDVTSLKHGEESSGVRRIISAIKKKRPRVVCFVGKVAFQRFSSKKSVGFGWNGDIYSSAVFVMHFLIRGKASVRITELKEVLRASLR